MPNQDEDSIRENLKYASSYLDLDPDGAEATLDGNFTLAELEQIVKVMRNRIVSFPDTMYCTTEEFLGAKGLEMVEKLAEDIVNNMNKTVLDIVDGTTRNPELQKRFDDIVEDINHTVRTDDLK